MHQALSFGDTVADNASAGLYVLGEQHVSLDQFSPVDARMRMMINGNEVSNGVGSDCLGDPLNAVAWLAEVARKFGRPLRTGQVVLAGALGEMRPVTAGDEVVVEISGLGSVSARFAELTVDRGE
ncbi:hypothetical protein GCM10027169_21810 [Gordonia jinhuaensis]|uniref:Fumarylacetoacetase-like C-terminal domain-containing protein n=1 Tax=Gordonia jinhuaensis TaxID=1517702 RepID=A0A916WZD5_9ACTN|nr:fumarylacetoacetate hydrolase family protein [Gordonia jinhuaensis]GGB42559.1 hypothetical protein GCM10011489_32580 [Gordonia jinhuaensis]